ncbi:MAG: DUF1461 domain-containing protein [Nanoarchaeota archaeon]
MSKAFLTVPLALFLTIIVFLACADFWMFNSVYIRKSYELGPYAAFSAQNTSKERVDEVTARLLLFLDGGQQDISDFFTPGEVSHLSDVRALAAKGKNLMLWSSILAILLIIALGAVSYLQVPKLWFSQMLKLVGIGITYAGILVLAGCGLLFVSFENFDAAFTGFHQVLFPQGNWQFPAGSHMITLFPEGFFSATGERIVLSAVICGLGLLLAGILLSRFGPLWKQIKREDA